jgi:hypothetical protein
VVEDGVEKGVEGRGRGGLRVEVKDERAEFNPAQRIMLISERFAAFCSLLAENKLQCAVIAYMVLN